MLIVTILVFIGLLLVLVLAHEFGHFLAAKKAGCRVEEFAFGFKPRLFSREFGGTTYSFNLLPIGGYVKIEGENMDESAPGPTSFASKSAGWRILILAAGVLMNILLAYILLTWQALVGVPTLITEENKHTLQDFKTYISMVIPESPAQSAGLAPLDRVVRIEGVNNPTIDDIQRVVKESSGKEISVEVERQGRHITTKLLARPQPPEGQGPLGITLATTGLARTPWWQAPWVGLQRTASLLTAIVTQFSALFSRLVREGTVGEALTGPIGIAVYTNEVTNLGLSYLLEFAALISINLALVNILPFPALDGGRILFVVIETIIGRRVPGRIENVVHTLGFVLLIILMLVITFNDIRRIF
jgi:regulator of sigma E protease